MSQPKKSAPPVRKLKITAIVAGVALGVACRYVPEDYKTACTAVAEITALSCGGPL